MDPTEPGQDTCSRKGLAAENGEPSEPRQEETPIPTRRQRRRNPKYTDYETDHVAVREIHQKKSCAARPQEEGATPTKTPKRRGRPPKAAAAGAPVEGRNMPKKTPVKKTPAKDQVAAGDTAQQENGTPRPKRKYTKRPRQQLDAVTQLQRDKEPAEPEEEVEPGGRRRRGAAKAALKYLHALATEVLNHAGDEVDSPAGGSNQEAATEGANSSGGRARKGRKRKRLDSDAAEDHDFVPEDEGEAEDMNTEEEEGEEEDEDLDLVSDVTVRRRSSAGYHNNTSSKWSNGLPLNFMRLVWDSAELTRKHREQHFSSWVFLDWIPSSADWTPVPSSDVEKYLPQELQSAAFRVSREGLKEEETPLQCLRRFEASPPHPSRWDTSLFVGGPVWTLEWCPTPDGAPATQYLALACHREMDDQHHVNQTYGGAGLVQLWDVSKLDYNQEPDRRPVLSYGLAQDQGFIWHLKWCPAGCWEPPITSREPPYLSRLGLLAVASSNAVVSVYSLPHPDALLSNGKLSCSDKDSPPVFKVRPAVTLRLGSFRAPRQRHSGMALSVDWLPLKPHNVVAVGFYDGVVGLWDLTTESALLRVRDSTGLSLVPHRCFLAHHNAVRTVSFCPSSRFLLVTAGDDHMVKTWDLRRLWDPITVQKRLLANEVQWLLKAPGLLVAQESAFAAKCSLGVHYTDYHLRSIMVVPRTTNVWSISYSDWLHSVVTSDSQGDIILALLPHLQYVQQSFKHFIERRFPISLTSVVRLDASEGEEANDMKAEGEREGGNQQEDDESPGFGLQSYKEAVKKHWLHHTDNNLVTFAGSSTRAVWKRMKNTETTIKLNLDDLPLAALHRVRFNPNMSSHPWVAAAGQTGIVRLNCLRSLTSPHLKEMISQVQALDSTREDTQGGQGQEEGGEEL